MKKQIWNFLYEWFPGHGHHLLPSSRLYDWQKAASPGQGKLDRSGKEQSDARLRGDSPRLQELRKRYADFDRQVTAPLVWTQDHISEENLRGFRGSDAYVSQDCGLNYGRMAIGLTYYYLLAKDHLKLLERLAEDPSFAAVLFEIDGRPLSRDLLDSVTEISFLDKEFGLSAKPGFKVLDIGAGYGRLARRMVQAMPQLGHYYCTDGVPESAFLCEHYLEHSGITDKASVVLLDEVERELEKTPIDLAVNIHSFSECNIDAIDWWIRLLAKHRVANLVVMPNEKYETPSGLAVEDGRDFLPVIEKHGYKRTKVVPKYDDPFVMTYGLDPGKFHVFSYVGS